MRIETRSQLKLTLFWFALMAAFAVPIMIGVVLK
jgi:hypothetical protein